jgi:2'-5' RNA ligase
MRLVATKNIHLTLKFLGDTDIDRLPALMAGLDGLGGRASAFSMALGDVGGFPNLNRTRVLWVGLAGDMQPLEGLASLVEEACVALDFKANAQPFSPHLTVARMRDSASPEERRKAGEALTSLPWEKGVPIPIDSFQLIKSTVTPQGPIYETLHTVSLGLSPNPSLP